ncbi:outer membrane protein [Bradyrhizobium sp. McL0615]|uniref:outer membrane protein n=1 Tax=Bradyrhizobium sp. McL0615 TaxID=3415673 RepID=UPI003CE8D91E
MKKILLTTTALIALGVAPAVGADLAARPYTKAPVAVAMYNWGGFYAGVNGGWGSSRNSWDETFGVVFPMGSHDATGGTVGGQIGYRWQAASWVFGVEAQGNWADFKGSNVIPLAAAFTNETRVDAFGLFTGQVGYAANNVLFYLKGGAAVTSDRYRMLATATGAQVVNSVDDTRWGGVVGVGLEYGFAPNWSAGIEYNHLFMQDKTYNFVSNGAIIPAGASFAQNRIRQDIDLVTARINYKFGAY